MSDIFQEIEESVRQDQLAKFLRRYGLYIVAAIVVLVAGIAGWRLYEGWSARADESRSEALATAQKLLSEGKAKNAAETFERLSREGPAAQRAMAQMERAQALIAQNDMDGALAAFDQAATAAGSDPILRDTARLRAAYLAADKNDLPALRARLEPLISAGGPISYSARELLGVAAWKAGDLALARQTMETLRLAFEAPDDVRQRAELVLAVIGATPAAAPAAPSATPAPATPAPAHPAGEPK